MMEVDMQQRLHRVIVTAAKDVAGPQSSENTGLFWFKFSDVRNY
jgi:hypothetical protein